MSEKISSAPSRFDDFSQEVKHPLSDRLLEVYDFEQDQRTGEYKFAIGYGDDGYADVALSKDGEYWVDWIDVSEDLQSKGIGHDLYLATAAHAAHMNAKCLKAHLVSDSSVRAAQKAFGDQYITHTPVDENSEPLESASDAKFDHYLPVLEVPLTDSEQ